MPRKLDCKVKVICPNEISGYVWKMNYLSQEATGVRRWHRCQPAPIQPGPTAGGHEKEG